MHSSCATSLASIVPKPSQKIEFRIRLASSRALKMTLTNLLVMPQSGRAPGNPLLRPSFNVLETATTNVRALRSLTFQLLEPMKNIVIQGSFTSHDPSADADGCYHRSDLSSIGLRFQAPCQGVKCKCSTVCAAEPRSQADSPRCTPSLQTEWLLPFRTHIDPRGMQCGTSESSPARARPSKHQLALRNPLQTVLEQRNLHCARRP